jgi:hypothetical protein
LRSFSASIGTPSTKPRGARRFHEGLDLLADALIDRVVHHADITAGTPRASVIKF